MVVSRCDIRVKEVARIDIPGSLTNLRAWRAKVAARPSLAG